MRQVVNHRVWAGAPAVLFRRGRAARVRAFFAASGEAARPGRARRQPSRRMSDAEKRTFTDDEALAFHKYPTPGKIAVVPTKPMATQRDLSLACSPGVAVPVRAIAQDPETAYDYTSKGN